LSDAPRVVERGGGLLHAVESLWRRGRTLGHRTGERRSGARRRSDGRRSVGRRSAAPRRGAGRRAGRGAGCATAGCTGAGIDRRRARVAAGGGAAPAPFAADVDGGVLVPHRRVVVEGLLEVGTVARADVGGGRGEPVLVEDRLHLGGRLAAVVDGRLDLLVPDLRDGLEGSGVVGRELV